MEPARQRSSFLRSVGWIFLEAEDCDKRVVLGNDNSSFENGGNARSTGAWIIQPDSAFEEVSSGKAELARNKRVDALACEICGLVSISKIGSALRNSFV